MLLHLNIKNESERVARILKFNVHLCHKHLNKFRNLLCNLNDRRNAPNEAGIIYKIGCNDCDSVCVRKVEDC